MNVRHCNTCNASYENTVERLIRCMTCVVRPNNQPPTKWRPVGEKA